MMIIFDFLFFVHFDQKIRRNKQEEIDLQIDYVI
jgi:hypothetical protein